MADAALNIPKRRGRNPQHAAYWTQGPITVHGISVLGSIPDRNFKFISTSPDLCLLLEQVGGYSHGLLLTGCQAVAATCPGSAGGGLRIAVPHRGWDYSGCSPAPDRPCRGLWWNSALRKCWPEGLCVPQYTPGTVGTVTP